MQFGQKTPSRKLSHTMDLLTETSFVVVVAVIINGYRHSILLQTEVVKYKI